MQATHSAAGQDFMGQIDNILMMTLINTVSASLISLVTDTIKYIFATISGIFEKIKEMIFEYRYGKMMQFSIELMAEYKRTPDVAKYIFEYVKEHHGFYTNNYTIDGGYNLTKDEVYVGNKYISVQMNHSKGEKDIKYTNKFTFCSRLHTEKEFEALCEKLVNKAKSPPITEKRIINYSKNCGNYMYEFDDEIDTPYSTELVDNIKHIVNTKKNANILLHGPPGTGKTNMIKYIAHEMNATVIVCNFSEFEKIVDLREMLCRKQYCCTDAVSLSTIFTEPEKKFFLFEDFDTMLPAAFWNKHKFQAESNENAKNGTTLIEHLRMPDFKYSELLNLLDGVIKNVGAYIFFTTNHVDQIDSAFYRPGRMHLKLYVGELTKVQICKFIKDKYAAVVDPIVIKRTTTLAECYSLYTLTKKASKFVTRLNGSYLSNLGSID